MTFDMKFLHTGTYLFQSGKGIFTVYFSLFFSLLKVFLQLRGFSVFLDIEKLNAGKFDEGLLASIVASKNFILVLTPNALDRCIGDVAKKDWIHRVRGDVFFLYFIYYLKKICTCQNRNQKPEANGRKCNGKKNKDKKTMIH